MIHPRNARRVGPGTAYLLVGNVLPGPCPSIEVSHERRPSESAARFCRTCRPVVAGELRQGVRATGQLLHDAAAPGAPGHHALIDPAPRLPVRLTYPWSG